MAHDDEYRHLIEDARDSLRALLLKTEPGRALALHAALRELNETLESADREAEQRARREATSARHAVDRDRERAWRKLSRPERAHYVLNALADDRLMLAEIAERIRSTTECDVYRGDLQAITNEMLARGDLDRVQTPKAPGAKGCCWRWYRRAELGADIRALDDAFDDAAAD